MIQVKLKICTWKIFGHNVFLKTVESTLKMYTQEKIRQQQQKEMWNGCFAHDNFTGQQ